VALAGLCVVVVKLVPPLLLSTHGLSGGAKAADVGRVRIALIVLLVGVLAAIALYYLARSLGLKRETQTAERFMRAIDQLGHREVDVRLAGIYTLERIARESPSDHGPIMEILAAFVRQHAPWPPPIQVRRGDGDQAVALATGGHLNDGGHRKPRPRTDVQAALTVLGRRTLAYDSGFPIGLAHTSLAGANLSGAHLERAVLSESNLEGADLFAANLRGADLEGANLQGASLLTANLKDTILWGANMEGARLYGANLEGAVLKGANLTGAGVTGADLKDAGLSGAILRDAHLQGANLEGAGLEGASLEGAGLEGANLKGAILKNATYDSGTVWPEGFDFSGLGAMLTG
jgi:hypothetical protein